MRLTPLCAITLALSLCGTAAAQVGVGTLVKHDTVNDPCEKFKIGVLMPADLGPKPRSENPAGALDPGMVWNPCHGDVTQFAGATVIMTPGEGTPPAAPFVTPQSPPPGSVQPPVLVVKLPPAFEMMRRH